MVEAAELLRSSRWSRGDKCSVDRLQPNREEDVCKEQTATLFIGCCRLSLLTLQSKSGRRLRQAHTLYEPANLDLLHKSICLERKWAQTHTCTKLTDSCINLRDMEQRELPSTESLFRPTWYFFLNEIDHLLNCFSKKKKNVVLTVEYEWAQ